MSDEPQNSHHPNHESGNGVPVAEAAHQGSPGLKLPFDPLRLVRALLRRWFWPFIPPFILGPIGIGIGLLLFKTGYTSEVQLIRREMESGFRVNQFGSAFKPGELTAETLVPLMHSVGLLTRVGSMVDPPMTGKELSASLSVTPERRTDLIRIALSTKRGAAQSAELANIYAKEVVKLTVDLQQQEATEINRFFSEELADLNRQLTLVNKEILQFSRDETFIDGDKETEAYLRDLGTVEMNLQNARIENQTLQYKVKSLREALRKHNPIATELKSAQENLTTLLVQYTDENPLVVEQRQHIASLEKQLESFAETESDDAAYTGGQLSDAIYLDLVKWKSDADSLVNRIASLETMRDSLKLKLEEIPGKNLNFLRLQSRKTTLTEMRDLIAARQTEAQVYQESALGYYRLF